MAGKRFLIVSGEPEVRGAFESLDPQLSAGCTFEFTNDVREGLVRLSARRYDGVIAEIEADGIDGPGLCRQLRSEPEISRCPIALITAIDTPSRVLADGIDAGAASFLRRPFGTEEICARLRSMADAGAAAETQDSESRFRGFLENAVFGVYESNIDGRFLAVNDALVRMLGYEDRAAVLALDIATEIYRRPADRDRLIESLKDRSSFQGIEADWKRADGSPLLARLSGVSVRDGKERVVGWQIMAEDVTERNRLADELQRSRRLEAVGQLAGGIAHDFNNILTVITGYGEIIADRLGPDHPLGPKAQEVVRSAGRARDLVRQLLAFSRRQVMEARTLDLNAVLEDMEKMLRRLIGENVLLETHRDPDLWPVLADPSQVEQVIANLAVNARDAMPDGGLLSFETKNMTVEDDPVPGAEGLPAGRYIVLTVTDSGTGMDPDTLSQIFEPFYTTKERGKGTGLGLSTVYGIVRQTGGQIRVESVVGTGTTFEVCLPATHHTPETKSARSEAAASGGGDETILLVEDEPGVRELTEELLAEAGYNVLSAEDGVEAMRVAHQHEGVIHLLLTDVVMPDLGGAGLAEAMSVLEPGTRVLYMTGHSRETMRQDGQLEPGTHLLTKPFTQESLLGKVREVLDSGAAAN